jgi:LCP family protein required for cell wall assembly
VVACIAAAVAVGTVLRKWDAFDRVDASSRTEPQSDDQPLNFLLVGSDSRDAVDASDPNADVFTGGDEATGGQRADTMIVLRYDPVVERVDILSIPRDLWVSISGHDTTERINTAFSYDDGPNTLIRTIQDTLDIPIHHYAEVDFGGFQELVDELGGVPMYFDTLYQDANSGFVISEPGCVTLDGYSALAFVRSRHLQYMDESGQWVSDPTADLGRISRQQVFIREALAQARGSMSLLDIGGMNAMLDIGIDHVTLDEELEPQDLAALGQRFAEFEGDTIQSHALTVEGFETDGGAQVVRLDEAASQPVLNIFRGVPSDEIDPAWVEVEVLNGSGAPGQAGLAAEALAAVGFDAEGVADVPGSAEDPLEVTRVRYAPGSANLADLVERHLTAGAELVEDPELSSAHVVVETGTDFTTVEEVARPEDEGALARSASTATTATDDEPPPTTSTTVVGHVPGEPPEGEECG